MQQHAPVVVVLVADAAGDALDLRDDAVTALGEGVGDSELEEPLNLGPPPLDCARQAGRLGQVCGDAGSQEPGLTVGGLVPALTDRAVRREELAVCSEELTLEFLAGPRGADLICRVVGGKHRLDGSGFGQAEDAPATGVI